ncbi:MULTISPECIES: acyl-ACP--UDP-N-acetylglucosamine O-acyltransferase [Rhizobium/Agrobacterium group]|uniref:Acyl-[acyl-carrier-protein]--UDP-N-acetylglucosamine O-acyltransferase n=1 Tax=Agrobacterium vitis TaxID=373 RepID=A0AAE2RDT4_AGRVI|nr:MULTISPECIES: acyl-ACP--UDP-N-acetylglucosamine O-acyltransferase [Rhizobium/Agrobacterium group]MBF2715902.1 acyl-ACP--UDP-N-acetylglucosamine O-acyltransferase [Agrobacterium vitis]MCF1435052.1 acyl-ACP--UDP-N-acetylglucosamine O-acyltransferase [Allorhizobium ampelinum]MUO90458.1 acyl-ACP--UDP-N-acetylglucosamine O-acyltransferase [Agrobacterium vitis]MUZ52879.1 acyl-ACP--UDP-N-acetylglucosamine O-acyltransferase [Agrobacterium vitis]MUZ91098.1 acyl-ACP--UDP-N-acetylglucosamine O-acyltra
MTVIPASARIHPSSVIEDGAVIGENVTIGPFCHVGPKVVLGDGAEFLSHVVLTGKTVVGKNSRIFPNAVIGGEPQSIHHSGEETTLTIGDNCTMREGVTINCGTVEGGGHTVVGSNNLFLANSHVAHDCQLGNHIILSNNVMLAGHVKIGDRAILGGGSAVHQFTRIGRQAFIGGLSACSYDVIPYGMLNGNPGLLGGLNVVGMTRAGVERATIHRVRKAYKALFDEEGAIREKAAAIREEFADCAEVIEILDFIVAESDRALSSPFRGKS